MYTDACVAAMGLDDPPRPASSEHAEPFEGVGEIVGWVRDLEAAWQDELDRARVVVAPADASRTYTANLPAPPAVVWDFVTSPGLRPQWQHGVTGVEEQPGSAGRRGVGTVNHCIHGKDAVVEEVLDWRPYDYVTLPLAAADPGHAAEVVNTLRVRAGRRRRHPPRAAVRPAALGEAPGDPRAAPAGPRRIHRARAGGAANGDRSQAAASRDAAGGERGAGAGQCPNRPAGISANPFPRTA